MATYNQYVFVDATYDPSPPIEQYPWIDTGIEVQEGDQIIISASGTMQPWQGTAPTFGPEGDTNTHPHLGQPADQYPWNMLVIPLRLFS